MVAGNPISRVAPSTAPTASPRARCDRRISTHQRVAEVGRFSTTVCLTVHPGIERRAERLPDLAERRELLDAPCKLMRALVGLGEQPPRSGLRTRGSLAALVGQLAESIGERAAKLCDADFSLVARVDGELIHLVATPCERSRIVVMARHYLGATDPA
jgi:hypothetical protein